MLASFFHLVHHGIYSLVFIKSINDAMDKAKADKLVYIAFIVYYPLEA